MEKPKNVVFGFKMVDGEIVIDQAESDVIRKAFEERANDKSHTEICRLLSDNPTRPKTIKEWNHWNINQMLNHSEQYVRYGIITKELAEKVSMVRLKNSRTAKTGLTQFPFRPIKMRKIVYCGKCGSKTDIIRRCNSNHTCQKCGYTKRVGESELIQILLKTKNKLANSEHCKLEFTYSDTAETIHIDNEINVMMSRKVDDMDGIKKLIFESANLKYNVVKATLQNRIIIKWSDITGIRRKRNSTTPTDDDVNMFLEAVEQIQVDDDKAVLILKRGD
jgi:hypothetical protein